MEEDEYYLDRYDCESAKVPIVSSSSSSTTATTTHPSSSSRMIPSRQASTDSSLSTPEVDNVNVMCDNDEEEEEEDYYEDDYDHLYVDTDGAEQYLREIWTQLGVGDAGYLNQNELFRVCEHIGMSASDEMIEQLFDKLDNDQDGRVSFDEFVDGLFKYVHKTATTTNYSNHQFQNENSQTHCELSSINQSPLSTSVIDADSNVSTFINEQSKTSSTNSSPKHAIGKSSSPSSTVSNSPSHCPRMNVEHMDTSTSLFITIPTDKDGYIETRKLLKHWQSLGFNLSASSNNGQQLLKNFGLNSKLYINVHELWSQMVNRLHHANDSELYQISLATILCEFSQLRINYEHLTDKCDRLQANLSEANSRAEFLAAEVDEQHCRMEQSANNKLLLLEKKYQDQIRIIELECSKERDLINAQNSRRTSDVEKQIKLLQEQIVKLRRNVTIIEEDNRRLENDNLIIKAQNGELEQTCHDLQQQVTETSHLHAKIVELKSYESAMEDQQLQNVIQELEKLKHQNKIVQDQNDELLAEKESLRQQLSAAHTANNQHRHQHQQQQQQQQHMAGAGVILDQNGNLVPSNISRSAKRKRRRKRNKHKNLASASSSSANDSLEINHQSSKNDINEEAVVNSSNDIGMGKDHFDDNMSTISTATIDTCTTIDTDIDIHAYGIRSHSKLSRRNSGNEQMEKRQRILFGHSRHSLDDEPFPIEDPVVEDEDNDWKTEKVEEVVDEDDDNDGDGDGDGDEDEDEDGPTTIIDNNHHHSQLINQLTPHYSSLSDEISEWASSQKMNGLFHPKTSSPLSGIEDRPFNSTIESILNTIKNNLYSNMINWNKNSINGNSNNISSSSFDTRTYEKDIEHQFQLQIPTHDFNLEELSQLIIDYLTKNQRFMRKNDHNNNPNRKGIHRFPTMTIASSSGMEWNSL